jgi:hypothetical protein
VLPFEKGEFVMQSGEGKNKEKKKKRNVGRIKIRGIKKELK